MITSVFSKSRPINYILITFLLVLFFLAYQLNVQTSTISWFEIGKILFYLILLIGSLYLTNFITKRNGLSKDNSYTFLLFFVFLILFPKSLGNGAIIISNIFILLTLRRLISLQSLITPKEKIFDASLWIFAAALFNFWCILFILLVYISIILDVSRDYRNWLIPIIAFLVVAIMATMGNLLFGITTFSAYFNSISIDFDVSYIRTIFQNLAAAIYIVFGIFAFFAMLYILPKKLSNFHHSYQKIIFCFIIGLAVFFISPQKDNSMLIYTFVPVAIMLTNYLETVEKYWLKETIVGFLALASVTIFILQLL